MCVAGRSRYLGGAGGLVAGLLRDPGVEAGMTWGRKESWAGTVQQKVNLELMEHDYRSETLGLFRYYK